MKRITKILILIVLLVTLTSCKGNSYRELFDKLYEENFELAEEIRKTATSDSNRELKVYELSEIPKNHELYYYGLNKELLANKEIDRIIVSIDNESMESSMDIEVIEYKTVEAAEQVMYEVDSLYAIYGRYENILYNLNWFGTAFVYGAPQTNGVFISNKENDVLLMFDDMYYKEETLIVPNNIRYITKSAIVQTKYVKKVVCGENVEKLGCWAMCANEKLECFIANEKLKVINRGALMNNPKLNTVKLNKGLEYIGQNAFSNCPSLEYVVVPESVKYIKSLAFTSGILYCEIESKPEGWDNDFVTDNVKVYWGNEWEYNEEGIPVLIEE